MFLHGPVNQAYEFIDEDEEGESEVFVMECRTCHGEVEGRYGAIVECTNCDASIRCGFNDMPEMSRMPNIRLRQILQVV